MKYGYIIGDFETDGNDFTWFFRRYDKDGVQTIYEGVMSERNLDKENIKIIGNKEDFKVWNQKYMPEYLK